jgi:hypothetical protein
MHTEETPNNKADKQFSFYTTGSPELHAALKQLQNDSRYNFAGTIRSVLEQALREKMPQLFTAKGKK